MIGEQRGVVLEEIVTRIHSLENNYQYKCRIVGLSATLPNYWDVADFLKVSIENTFYFDSSYRPIPLT